MTETEILKLIKYGENIHILFGVNDDGVLIGVSPQAVDQMKKDFVTAVNNPNKVYPPIYLMLEEVRIGEHIVLHVYLEGINSVSARDKILREIFSNLLAHRDYSSAYVAKFVIEKQSMYTENASRAHGFGMLELSSFEPFSKNPSISKVFRETSLADEPGSGMRNTYKYAKLYSGGMPEFIEGNVFKTLIPLTSVAVGKVGPSQIYPYYGKEQRSGSRKSRMTVR